MNPNEKPADQRASSTLNIRVRPADLDQWRRSARHGNITLSAWVIHKLNQPNTGKNGKG